MKNTFFIQIMSDFVRSKCMLRAEALAKVTSYFLCISKIFLADGILLVSTLTWERFIDSVDCRMCVIVSNEGMVGPSALPGTLPL